MSRRFQILASLLSVILALPASAYDPSLSEEAIREAYFLGARQGGLGAEFLAHYSHTIPEFSVGAYVSLISVSTPFAQVALHASRTMNYSAQDAVKDFHDKVMVFRIHMEICYMPDAPPDSLKVKLVQNKKEIVPDFAERSAYYPPTDAYTHLPSIGETIDLGFRPDKFDSSNLTIQIATPDGRTAETEFNLQTLR